MNAERAALRDLSQRIGADPLLVQAAGGNTSLKDNDVMWIKASGTWLTEARDKDIFVPVALDALRDALKRDDPACETSVDFVRSDLNATALRPSIETTVHALMPQRVVLHVHCVNTIAWAVLRDAEARLSPRLDGLAWRFIPYARPGLPLARAIAARLEPATDVLVLGNHGLVVAAETVAEATALLERVVARLSRLQRKAPKADLGVLSARCAGAPYRLPADPVVHALATEPANLAFARQGTLYPDHIVFLGPGVTVLAAEDSAARMVAPLVLLPGAGALVRTDARSAVEPMARCLADVVSRIAQGDEMKPLTPDDEAMLVNWDAEKYRQSLSR